MNGRGNKAILSVMLGMAVGGFGLAPGFLEATNYGTQMPNRCLEDEKFSEQRKRKAEKKKAA